MEYLSLSLVLSFIPLHNIYLVFSGILIACYLLNKKYINNFLERFNSRISFYKERQKERSKGGNSDKLVLIDDKNEMSLVEKVEESGIIPSISEDENNIAA